MHTPSSIRPALLSCPEWISGDDAGRRGLQPFGQQRRQQEEDSARNNRGNAIVVQQMVHHPAEPKRCGDLRNHHERVEDSM